MRWIKQIDSQSNSKLKHFFHKNNIKEVFRIDFVCTKTFLCSLSFFHKLSVIVDFTFKMVKLDYEQGCPYSQRGHQFASSLPHCNCPEGRSRLDTVRRRTDEMREIILVPLETNVNDVIPLPRIIKVQEANKMTDLSRRMELRGNMNNDIAVISRSNDNGIISESNNQIIHSNAGKK